MSLRFACLLAVACAAPEVEVAPAPAPADSTLDRAHPELRNADHQTWGPLVGAEPVWSPTREWAELDAAPGLAWGANSGLDWDEKYRAWIASLEPTDSEGAHETAELTTPWGDTLPLNRMECAESAILLRATFAAWYDLPFFLSGYSPALGRNVFYGHFGMVTSDGVSVPWEPNFNNWDDHTDTWDGAAWPDDASLESLALTALQDDHNGFLGPDAYSGAYLDEIHLNKRVGHFLLRTLTDFGSIHLAHSENLFDLTPEAMQAGDILTHRWQAQGVGHTMVVKSVDTNYANTEIEMLAGNMPRIQPRWYSHAVGRGYFSHDFAGSAAISPNAGVAYSELGGGLKRWRSAEQRSGRWVNVVPAADVPDFIDPDDDAALGTRTETFESLLGAATPEDERDALLAAIDASREALRSHPSSCANRERRERAFDDLYTHMETAFDMTRPEVDATYRLLEDYVFAELEYSASATCCWNSSTPEMHGIIMDHANQELLAADAAGTCVEPTPFTRVDGDYATFSDHAASLGLPWVPWSADEDCPQADATDDIIVQEPFTAWCDLDDVFPDDPVDPDPVDPTDPADPEQGGSSEGCGCNNANLQSILIVFLAGMVVRRSRRGAE